MDMGKDDGLRTKGNKKVTISASIDPQVATDLDEYCKEQGTYRANVVEKAVKEFLEREGKKKK